MKKNLKTALYTGLITGLSFGLVDVIAKIIKGGFQYFELYQTLLFHGILFTITFFVLGIIIRILTKSASFLRKFYPITGFYVFFLFFIPLTIKQAFFYHRSFFFPVIRNISLIVAGIITLVYIIMLVKAKKSKNNSQVKTSLQNKYLINKIVSNLVFLLVIFIIISFVMDLFQMNQGYSIPEYSFSGETNEPNVIIITIDTVRADHTTLYDPEIKTTPHLAELAKTSVVFDNAVSSASWTLPSHASMFTGKLPSNHMANKKHFFLNFQEDTLAEILRADGYNTAAFIGGPYCKEKYGIGQGFTNIKDRMDWFEFSLIYSKFSLKNYLDVFFPVNEIVGADGERTALEINKDVFEWLEKSKDTQFFLFVNYFDAHDPYNLGKEYRPIFMGNASSVLKPSQTPDEFMEEFNLEMTRHTDVDQKEVDLILSMYDAEIYSLDKQVQLLLDKLEELGLMENTVIIITGDHGEEFHDHGAFFHGKTIYEEVLRVPFLVYHPDYDAKRIETRVNNMDIFSTVLEFTGLEEPEGIDGTSLLPLITGQGIYDRDYTIAEGFGRWQVGEAEQQISMAKDGWKLLKVEPKHKYIYSGLYHLETDEYEQENIYASDLLKRSEMEQELISIYHAD
ncbi:MAG: sulfatase [Nanoarchaeota archaeon]|nr:sulfatase [Nanoarchaeota archaeon]